MMNTRCTKLSMVRDDSKSSKTSNKKCPVVLHGDHIAYELLSTDKTPTLPLALRTAGKTAVRYSETEYILSYILEKLFSENDLLFGFRKKLTVTKGSIGGSDCTNYNPSLTYPSNIPSLTHPLKQQSKTVHYITLITYSPGNYCRKGA